VKLVLWGGGGVLALAAAGVVAWIFSLPQQRLFGAAAHFRGRGRCDAFSPDAIENASGPLIAIIGINDATETTDYLMPYGILRRADVADVVALAQAGADKTVPALTVKPDATTAAFDAQHPEGRTTSSSRHESG